MKRINLYFIISFDRIEELLCGGPNIYIIFFLVIAKIGEILKSIIFLLERNT